MVLLAMDIVGTLNIACLLALLVIPVSAIVDQADLAAKDIQCENLHVRDHDTGTHYNQAEAAYDKCKEELDVMVHHYVWSSAKNAGLSAVDWVSKNSRRYDTATGCYVLEVRGGTNSSLRHIYVNMEQEVTLNNDQINERFLRLKEKHASG